MLSALFLVMILYFRANRVQPTWQTPGL